MTDAADARAFTIFRLYSDSEGHTRIESLELPNAVVAIESDTPSHVVRDIPASTVHITELLEWQPQMPLHRPPRRQFVLVLQGAMQITTTGGDQRRFGPGSCFIAEDMEGVGHFTDDVGDDRLVTMSVGLPADWRWPGR